ncbi:unnamed protein product [Medioppia subpectinata]|uniref:Carboxylesterase type B domain-containing protein n=1 Tax=Medioppia subpectinata TaxID=1979941 RepID=A0A7R9QBU5_9ACAR|nr:unnamed protein product [Medioppia subpectinata]CAG2117964.1 unnamed protein product [Medioppia subpectinata]
MILIYLLLICVQYVTPYPRQHNCSSIVYSNKVSFYGCEDNISTESITNRKNGHKLIYTFKGIPYAKPPVGALRFRKPVAIKYDKKTKIDAKNYQKPCMQSWIVDHPFGIMSEDCLYLNVWTPTLNSSANLPVMIWIYGGSFTIGSSSQFSALYLTSDNIYEGTQLALRNVVIVTLNYRLGIFGFLYGNSADCPGNQGLWDQAVAIQWVKDNIRAFGGNPNDTTLFGESAGSISISNHIVSNVTRHMFQKAIMQSGSAYIKLFSRDTNYSYKIARRFASNKRLFRRSGACVGTDWIQCLRSKSAYELLNAQLMSIIHNPSKPWYTVYIQQFTPVFGDEFVPISVNRAVNAGDFRKDIHILMGHLEMEGLLFTSAFDLGVGMAGRYLPFVPIAPVISKEIVYNDIRNYFFDNDTIGITIAEEFTKTFDSNPRLLDRNGLRRAATHAFGDYFLTCPTVLFGGGLVTSDQFVGRVYQYRLTYSHRHSISRYSTWSEATHTDDIALVFGAPFNDRNLWTNGDRRLSKQMMNIWTHFATHGVVPEVNGKSWPMYGLTREGRVNASYVELHANRSRMGTVWTNRYTVNDNYNPPLVGDCFYFWRDILDKQF